MERAPPRLKIDKLSKFIPQAENTNRHTERGMVMLEESMRRNGFFDGMTAAANGNIIDGSARIEKSALLFPDEAIVLEHDGTRPIVEVRTDIPSAQDPRAKQIALAANRIAQVNLSFDPAVLQCLATEIDLTLMWDETELKSALHPKQAMPFLLDEEPPDGARPWQGTPPADQARHPLSVVLTNAQKRDWDAYKEQLGVSSDTSAFVNLFAGRDGA